MLRRNIAFLSCAACGFVAVGCDPVRSTRQIVVVRVTDSASGNPIAGATVQLKDDFDRGVAESVGTQRLSKEMLESGREAWESRPWITGATNEVGDAEICIEVTALDRTRGPTPRANRDVTGNPFLVKIDGGRKNEDVLSVRMKSGEIVEGKSYSVSVIRIEYPRYIESP